jgi:hypothetical protein
MAHPAPAAGAGVDVAQKLAAQLGIAALHRLGKQRQLELLQFRVGQLRQERQTFHIVFSRAGRGHSGLGQVTLQLGDLSFDLSGPFGAIHHGF